MSSENKNKKEKVNRNVQFFLDISEFGDLKIDAYIPKGEDNEDLKRIVNHLASTIIHICEGDFYTLLKKAILKAGTKYECEDVAKLSVQLAIQEMKKKGSGPFTKDVVVPPTKAFSRPLSGDTDE